ncbi:hypothetical protein [Azospirillum sp. B2RO_4]|uniref:hypothetical protein n=1 Tax=Azospirillum sp. B2RO_4 TaxID=3027796 RepID=UPI003DA7CD03
MAFGGIFRKAWSSATSAAKTAAAKLATGATTLASAPRVLKNLPAAAAAKVSSWIGEIDRKIVKPAQAAVQAVKQAAHSVVAKATDLTRKATQIYNKARATFSKVNQVKPIEPCPFANVKGAQKPSKVKLALSAVNKLVDANASGGIKEVVETGLGMAGYLYQDGKKNKKTLTQEFMNKLKMKLVLPGTWKMPGELYKMGIKYSQTGYLMLKKGNPLNVAHGRYKLWTPFLNNPLATKTGKAIMGKAGLFGAGIEVAKTFADRTLDPGGVKEGAVSAYSKAAVKGVAKGIASKIIIGKATAAGAAIGTAIFPGAGTVIGGVAGFAVGVGVSLASDKIIDHAVDATWTLAGKAAAKAAPVVKDLAGKAADLGHKATASAKKVWDEAKSVSRWATKWF